MAEETCPKLVPKIFAEKLGKTCAGASVPADVGLADKIFENALPSGDVIIFNSLNSKKFNSDLEEPAHGTLAYERMTAHGSFGR